MSTLLGIDIGSSSIICGLLKGKTVLKESPRTFFKSTHAGNRVEVQPETVLKALAQAIKGLGADAKQVDAITLATMCPAWCAMDAKGQALTPIITHQDRRSLVAHPVRMRTTAAKSRIGFGVVMFSSEAVDQQIMKVAFISGTSIVKSDLFATWEVKTIETEFGPVTYKTKDDKVLINRHGYEFPLPPHTINYRANIRALADLGFTDVVSLNSVGSLDPEMGPGTFVSCADYLCLQEGPKTFYDQELKGGPPGIANNLIPDLLAQLSPESKAEIRVVKAWGDVIGMTAAFEADLCTEAGLNYNSLALIDNFANGLAGTEIDFAKFPALVKENQAKVNRLFTRMLEIFA